MDKFEILGFFVVIFLYYLEFIRILFMYAAAGAGIENVAIGLLNVQQFNVERQSGIWWNDSYKI